MKRWILTAFVLVGCSGTPVVPVVIEAPDTILCPQACDHLRALGCPEGEPLEDGTTCETFCVTTQKNGFSLNLSCIVDIKACPEMDACTAAPR